MGLVYKRLAAAATAGLCAVALPLPSPRAADAPLSGRAAFARLVGNTVRGRTPDGPYSEYFAPGGALTIVDGDGKAGGRWTLDGERLCTEVDDEEKECRTLEVAGASGAFVDQGGARYDFTIAEGNPEGL